MTYGIKALGICSWGYTHGNQALINPVKGELHQATYNPNVAITKGSNPPLNPDHTHFLMVDDGLRNRYGHREDKEGD